MELGIHQNFRSEVLEGTTIPKNRIWTWMRPSPKRYPREKLPQEWNICPEREEGCGEIRSLGGRVGGILLG